MLIDIWLGKLWDITLHYGAIAVHAPTQFERHHWIILSAVAVTVGCLCLRGNKSRCNF